MMETKKPLVSVCIPAYNSEKTLDKTVKSILKQTYPNLEIIVLDNASTDNTEELLSDYAKDHKIKYYRNETTLIAEDNFSKCVELANGEYIAVFHADDVYKPQMVEKQVQSFLDNPSIGAVFTLADLINEDGEKIGKLSLPSDLEFKDVYDFNEIFTATLKNENFLICPSAMVKSEVYKELIPFAYDKFKTSSDLDMWFRILEKHPISILNENLMCYRISKTQGFYQVMYLRTEKMDFSKVMDYYISKKLDFQKIPDDALKSYECLDNGFKIMFAENYLIKGQVQEAKILLKETFSIHFLLSAIRYKRSVIFLIMWGLIALISIYLGVWGRFGKFLNWYMYKK